MKKFARPDDSMTASVEALAEKMMEDTRRDEATIRACFARELKVVGAILLALTVTYVGARTLEKKLTPQKPEIQNNFNSARPGLPTDFSPK